LERKQQPANDAAAGARRHAPPSVSVPVAAQGHCGAGGECAGAHAQPVWARVAGARRVPAEPAGEGVAADAGRARGAARDPPRSDQGAGRARDPRRLLPQPHGLVVGQPRVGGAQLGGVRVGRGVQPDHAAVRRRRGRRLGDVGALGRERRPPRRGPELGRRADLGHGARALRAHVRRPHAPRRRPRVERVGGQLGLARQAHPQPRLAHARGGARLDVLRAHAGGVRPAVVAGPRAAGERRQRQHAADLGSALHAARRARARRGAGHCAGRAHGAPPAVPPGRAPRRSQGAGLVPHAPGAAGERRRHRGPLHPPVEHPRGHGAGGPRHAVAGLQPGVVPRRRGAGQHARVLREPRRCVEVPGHAPNRHALRPHEARAVPRAQPRRPDRRHRRRRRDHPLLGHLPKGRRRPLGPGPGLRRHARAPGCCLSRVAHHWPCWRRLWHHARRLGAHTL
ncbi:hypothetical protein GGF44_003564, partial [Coemansia sp. RSA 1694]